MGKHAMALSDGSAAWRQVFDGHWRFFLSTLVVLVFVSALAAPPASSKTIKDVIGASGAGDGQFASNSPRGIAVNATGAGGVNAGDVYVVDTGNNRVQRFSGAGVYLSQFGVVGTGAGQLSNPTGVAVDQTDGSVYVHDTGNRRVAKYTATGVFLFAFGAGVANGTNVLQTCTTTCLQGLSSVVDGGFGTTTISSGLAVAPLGAPNAGHLFVADVGPVANRRLQEFTAPGVAGPATFVNKVGGAGSALGQFGAGSPADMAVDDAGSVYAVDPGNSRVQVFNSGLGSPAIFSEAELSGAPTPLNIAIDPGAVSGGIASDDRIFVVKPCNSTTCPPGSLPPPFDTSEIRIKELKSDGTLVDTHMTGTGITSVSRGLSRNSVTERLYLTSAVARRAYIIDDVFPPAAAIDPPTEIQSTSAKLSGEIDPNGSRTDYRFELSTDDGATWKCIVVPSCADPANLVDAGKGEDPVQVSLTPDLSPGTIYLVRLTAIKPFGAGTAITGTEEFETDAIPPDVITGAVAPRGTTTAFLTGAVNPNGFSTEIHFEYGTTGPCESNPCESTPVQNMGSEFILVGLPFAPVGAELDGLLPETVYHYRIVASNDKGETTEGSDRTFATRAIEAEQACTNEEVRIAQNATYLPDCRAFELINNPEKGNQFVGLSTASADAGEVLWNVVGGAPGSNTGAQSWFAAERTPSGWRSAALAPAAAEQIGNGDFEYRPVTPSPATPDFSAFVFTADSKQADTLVRLDREQGQEELRTYDIGLEAPNNDLTDDAAHVVLINPDTEQLEDAGTPGAPEVISIMPDGTESVCGLDGIRSFIGSGSSPDEAASVHWHPGYRMISAADASRVYFQAKPNGSCGPSGLYGLYVRNREGAGETTLVDPGTIRSPEFIRASQDGGSAYFTTFSNHQSYEALSPAEQEVTAPIDTEEVDNNEHGDVYRWDEEAGSSSCVTCEAHADVHLREYDAKSLTSVLVSGDFSTVYFESEQQLIAGRGAVGEGNIYALSDGQIDFVATAEEPLGQLRDQLDPQLSADGEVHVFVAPAGWGLTMDDVATECPGSFGPVPCTELYRYDNEDGSLECVSCLHGGMTEHSVKPEKAVLSSDGTTIAFETAQALVPEDLNEETDIYRWRDGLPRLVSDGLTDFPAPASPNVEATGAPTLSSISADGDDIFFTVAQPGLTGFERDGTSNAYTAKVGGGFEPPAPIVPCSGDSCQGPLLAPPAPVSNGSAFFQGAGNEESRPDKRGCAAKRGKAKHRCIAGKRKRRCAKKHGEAKRRCLARRVR